MRRDHTLRRAAPEDRDFLYETKAEALKPYVVETWGSWDEGWQRERFDRSFDSRRFQIVMVGSERIGFLETSQKEDCLRIDNIALTAAWRDRGIGSALIREIVEEAGQRIRLRVLKTNPARGFYERLGFEVVGDSGEHWEMVREAPGPPQSGG